MQSSQINEILQNVQNFGGVFPADQITECELGKFYIINSAPSNDPGIHWLAVYLTKVPEFFDSLGHSPMFYQFNFEDLMISHGPKYMYNTRRLQNYGSSMCGQYCIYYIISRAAGYSIEEIVQRFDHSNLRNNDTHIENFYNRLVPRLS